MRTHGHRKGSTKHWGLLGGKGEGQWEGVVGRDSLGRNAKWENLRQCRSSRDSEAVSSTQWHRGAGSDLSRAAGAQLMPLAGR